MQRTEYMQKIMMDTYNGVAIEAIKNGFNGAWERLIARKLQHDAKRDISEAVVILESVDNDALKAAQLVYNSKSESVCLD